MAEKTLTPEAVKEALAKWKSTTLQTVGPLVDTTAYNALTASMATLDAVIDSIEPTTT